MRVPVRCLVSLATFLAITDAAAAPKKGKPRGNPRAAPVAQPPAAAPEGHKTVSGIMPGPLRFGRLGSDEGLPSGVYSIAQDGRGFLYFGTRTGLARYDGHEVKILLRDPKNPASLPSSEITALATDRGGRLWVGTEAGLSRLDPTLETFVHVRDPKSDPNGLLGSGIGVLYVDTSDTLWAGLKTGGVARVDGRTGAMRLVPQLAEFVLSSVAERPDGLLLLGSVEDGVLVYDGKAERVVSHYTTAGGSPVKLTSDQVSALHVDKLGRTWIGTVDAGLVTIDKGGNVVAHRHDAGNPRSLSHAHVLTIFTGPANGVWVGTIAGGLNQFDESTGDFIRHSAAPSERDRLSQSEIRTGVTSRDGVAWLGIPAGDVSYFDSFGLAFQYYRSADTPITAIVEDPASPDSFWMGTPHGMAQSGLYRVHRPSGRYTLYEGLRAGTQLLDMKEGGIWALHADGKGSLWIGTQELGLIQYRPEGESVVQYKVGADDTPGHVNTILPDPSGVLWLGTWGDGLVKFNPATGAAEQFTAEANDDTSIGSDHIYTIARDLKDAKYLWVGTAEGGLNHFDTTRGTAERFVSERDNPKTLSNNNVTTIHQDASGRLWVGTFGGGLNLFDPAAKTWKRYEGADHPSSVFGILEDERGALWLSTNGEGLLKLDPKTDQMIVYTARDGLPSDEFAQGGYHRGASGTFYFGSPKGATVFRPDAIPSITFTPPLVLTEFRVFDKPRPVPGGGGFKLSHLDSVVAFQFAALDFADPRRVRYEYRLSGLHDVWIPTREHSVTFSLDSGSYLFELRARGRHGAPTSASLAIPFEIAPPPWRTWWAYTIYGLAVLGAALAFLQYQRRKIVRIEQQNRLATAEREIQLTAAVHSGFLPDANQVTDEGFGLVGVYRPAGQCSGDWWWHERLNGHVHLIACGDVTGHGPGPAMVTASVSTTFRVMRSVWAESGPREFLRIANEQVMRSGRGRYLMQIMVAEFDTLSGQLSFHSAAGFPAVCLLGGQFKIFTARGVPLGTPSFDSTVVTTSLSPGDRFMLMTDGIPEIELASGRRLGLRRLTKIYEETASMPLPDAAAHMLAAAESANQKREQDDDWTFVLAEWVRRTGAPPERRPSASGGTRP